MTQKNLIAGGLVVSSLLLGFAGQAEAANLVQKYDVTQFSDSEHAFWFSGLKKEGLADNTHFLFDEAGRLNVYDDGTATLTGVIYQKGPNQDISNTNKKWDVDLKFNLVENYSGGIKDVGLNGMGFNNNDEKKQYAHENWSFWTLDEGSVLTGMGEYQGSEIFLHNRAFGKNDEDKKYTSLAQFEEDGKTSEDFKVRGQLGIGANDKNGDLGFSYWYGYTGDVTKNGETTSYDANSHKDLTMSDINVKLTKVPEPATMSLMSLGMIGLGASVLKRKQQS